MLSFTDWIILHKYPSKGLIDTIKIPERYYYFMERWHQIQKPNKYSYLDDMTWDDSDNHKYKVNNLLTDWFNMQPLWTVNGCYVYKFKSPPPKGLKYKYLAVDSLRMRYYCYSLDEQPKFKAYKELQVPLCLYFGFNPPLPEVDSNPLNNAYRVCKFEQRYLDGLRFDYEVSTVWNDWIKATLSELSKSL